MGETATKIRQHGKEAEANTIDTSFRLIVRGLGAVRHMEADEGTVTDRLAGLAWPRQLTSAAPPEGKPRPSHDSEEIDEVLNRIELMLGEVALDREVAAQVHSGEWTTEQLVELQTT